MGIKTRVTFAAAMAIAVAFLPKVEDTKYKVYTDIAGVSTVCEGITGPDVIKGKPIPGQNAMLFGKAHPGRKACS